MTLIAGMNQVHLKMAAIVWASAHTLLAGISIPYVGSSEWNHLSGRSGQKILV